MEALGNLGIDGYRILLYLVNFGILIVLLQRFVYKPVLKFIDERQEKIENSVKRADEIEKRVIAIESEREEIIKEARRQATETAEKAKNEGDARRDEIISAAKREVERVVASGKKQLEEDRAEMMRSVRKDIVDIVVKASARIVSDAIDEKKSQSLAEEVVRKMT